MTRSKHSMVIQNDGNVVGFGLAEKGQLGSGIKGYKTTPTLIPTNMTDVKKIEGVNHALFILKNDGTLYYTGNFFGAKTNTFTQVTVPNNAVLEEIYAYSDTFFAKDVDGNIYASGNNSQGQYGTGTTSYYNSLTLIHDSTVGIIDIAVGHNFAIFLKSDGSVHGAGYNYYGQIGQGTNDIRSYSTMQEIFPSVTSPVITDVGAGQSSAYALQNDGTFYAWGHNYYYQLGLGDREDRYAPEVVVNFNPAPHSEIRGGSYSTHLIDKQTNALFSWGYGSFGTLMSGSTDHITQPTEVMSDVIEVKCGTSHTLVLKSDRTVWSGGYNTYGEVGVAPMGSYYTNTQIGTDMNVIGVGSYISLITNQTTGDIYAFGENDNGQLGLGYYHYEETPVTVESNAKQVDTGNEHTLLLKEDKTVWSTGENSYGELGLGHNKMIGTFEQITQLQDIKEVKAGYAFSAVLEESGTLWVWGNNPYGLLGNGDLSSTNSPTKYLIENIDKAECGSSVLYTLTKDGKLYATGKNNRGIVTADGTTDSNNNSIPQVIATDIKDMAVGENHALWIKKDGTLWSIGYGTSGQLGLGDTTEVLTPTQVGTDNDWNNVKTDYYYTILEKNDGSVYYTGYNGYNLNGASVNAKVPTLLETNATSNLKMVGLGHFHILWLSNEGQLYGTGNNMEGRLAGNYSSSETPFPNVTNVKAVMGGIKLIQLFLIQDGTTLKTWNDELNNWEEVGNEPATESIFRDRGMRNLSLIDKEKLNMLNSTSPNILMFVGATNIEDKTLNVKNIPSPQVVYSNNDINLLNVESINNVQMEGTVKGEGNVKVIVSKDSGVTWHTWDNLLSNWKTIDISQKETVKTNGMSKDILNNLGTEEWNEFLINEDGSKVEKIRFAYYLEEKKLEDIANTDLIKLHFNMRGKWSKVADNEFYYEYPNNKTLAVEVYKDGDFKINY